MSKPSRYTVEVAPSVLKLLRRLPKTVVGRLVQAIESLSDDPRPRGCRKLAGSDESYRLRVGDWRIIYSVEDDRLIIWVLEVGHRREVYRNR